MAKAIYVSNTKVKKIYVQNTKVKKVYVGNTLAWTSAIAQDQGVNMNSVKFTTGNGANNGISGGTTNNWTLQFTFVWKTAKGGALMYHNYNKRESVIKILDDGRIMVNANRYDTSNYKTGYSTQTCEVGKLNMVSVNRNGVICINGVNATPSTYGGDMPLWGEVIIFPDRDINGTCLGLNGWNQTLSNTDMVNITKRDYAFESDNGTTLAMSFDGNLTYRRNTLSSAQKDVAGTATYETWEWNEDRECTRI